MITNCELPLCLLKENNELNHFDLVLFHLLRDNPSYRKWAYEQRRLHQERIMILDNSAYEFFVKGEVLNLEEYAEMVRDLQPDFFILPDVLQDRKKTIAGISKFLEKYPMNDPKASAPKPMVVLQGNTDRELTQCMFDYIKMGLKNICIPFHIECFKNSKKSANIRREFEKVYGSNIGDDIEYAMGRVNFTLNHAAALGLFDYVHLLGSHCPLEKIFYGRFNSMDTGYPVKLGVEGVKLFKETHKPNIIIDDFLEEDLNEEKKTLIRNNVRLFRDLPCLKNKNIGVF